MSNKKKKIKLVGGAAVVPLVSTGESAPGSVDSTPADWCETCIAPLEEILNTCHHEAGHAVALWAFTGITPDEIWIYRDGSGRVVPGISYKLANRPLRGTRRAVYCFAGAAAECRLDDADWLTSTEEDRERAVWWRLEGSSDDPDADWRQGRRACRDERSAIRQLGAAGRFVDAHWGAIERLAQAMYRRIQEHPDRSYLFSWPQLFPFLPEAGGSEFFAAVATTVRRPL